MIYIVVNRQMMKTHEQIIIISFNFDDEFN